MLSRQVGAVTLLCLHVVDRSGPPGDGTHAQWPVALVLQRLPEHLGPDPTTSTQVARFRSVVRPQVGEPLPMHISRVA
jgi:hypothetical protein